MAKFKDANKRFARDVNINFNDSGDHAEIKWDSVCLARSEDRENMADIFDKFVDYMKNGDFAFYKPETPGEVKTIIHALCYECGIKLY